MKLLEKLFGKTKPVKEIHRPDTGSGTMTTLQCPRCRRSSDMYLGDPNCTWLIQRPGVGDMLPAECPYCKIGMLVCVRDRTIINIEPFGDAPSDLMAAIERTVSKVGQR